MQGYIPLYKGGFTMNTPIVKELSPLAISPHMDKGSPIRLIRDNWLIRSCICLGRHPLIYVEHLTWRAARVDLERFEFFTL